MQFRDTEVLTYGSGDLTYANDLIAYDAGSEHFLSFFRDDPVGSGLVFAVNAIEDRGGVREIDAIATENRGQPSAALEVGDAVYVGLTRAPAPLLPVGIVRYDVSRDGIVQGGVTTDGLGPAFRSGFDDLASVTVSGTQYLSAISDTGWQIATWKVTADGSLKPTQLLEGLFDSPGGTNFLGQGGLLALEPGGRPVLAAVGYENAPITTFRVTDKGKLKPLDALVPENRAFTMNNLNLGEAAEAGGRSFVILADEDLGLQTYRIGRDGSIVLADEARDGDAHGLRDVQAIEVVDFDGRTVVLAGGASSEVAAFELLENGALVDLGSLVYDGAALAPRTRDLETAVIGTERLLYASTTDDALRAFRLELDDDPIAGGAGDDRLRGGAEADQIRGLGGDDRLLGRDGDDALLGGKGGDTLEGAAGDDHLSGDSGKDLLLGGAGHDWAYGGGGRDRIKAGDGDDRALGGGGKDVLDGGDGADELHGEGGADRLTGRAGADVLHDGAGRDRMKGGADADTFVMADDGDADVILDFEDGSDRIDLSAEGPELRFADLRITQEGDAVRIAYGGEELEVRGAGGTLDEAQLSFADFIFLA